MVKVRIKSLRFLVERIDSWPRYQDDADNYREHMKDYYYFMVEGYTEPFGYVHKENLRQIRWPKYWLLDEKTRQLTLTLTSASANDVTTTAVATATATATATSSPEADLTARRTALVLDTIRRIHEAGILKRFAKWKSDLVPVYSPDGDHVLSITTNAPHLFGTISYGVTLIAWTRTPSGKRQYWLQKRSMQKSVHPGKLDTTASGALRQGERAVDSMVKRAVLEAGFDKRYLYDNLKPRGTISYHLSWNSDGSPVSMPHVLYAYELELDPGVVPMAKEGESDEFVSMNEEEIRDSLFGDEFKPIVGVVWIGHFARHGIMTAENEMHFEEICARIHRRHRMFIV